MVTLLVVVLLCAVGVAGGYGLGKVVDGARDLLAGPESLPADKVAAPEPLDMGGPATTCAPEDVDVRLSASSTSLTAGSPVSFMVRVANVGRVPCLFDGAAASRAVTITDETGKEKIWSSADCGDGSTMLLVGPEDVNVGEVHWKSVRGCAKKAPTVGAGTYRATASLADVPGATSEPVTLTVAAKAKAAATPSPGATPGADEKAQDAKADPKADGAKAEGEPSDKAAPDGEKKADPAETESPSGDQAAEDR